MDNVLKTYRQFGQFEPREILALIFSRPDECLTICEALDLYTTSAAFLAGREADLGRLFPDYQADFIVLDRDVCTYPEQLTDAKVLQVWVAGQRKL